MEIKLRYKIETRRIMDELHMQLFEAAYWVAHYWGQVIHNTELDRRLDRAFGSWV
jgi:hypothetical protein